MTDNAPGATGSSLPEAAGRPEHLPDGPQRIVVGLDGSAASVLALLFAAQEAQLRGGVLHLVTAYEVTPFLYAGGLNIGSYAATSLEDAPRLAAEERLKEAADTVAARAPGAPVHVQTTVAEGRASQVLLAASHGATLLVVGARGVGGFTRMMLGSTSTEVVHHARLPVTVVPAEEDSTDAS